MLMNRPILLSLLLLFPAALYAQSATTQDLHKKHTGALSLFFYNNTLRMINQNGDREFDQLIEDIEKMRFLMIRKTESNFDNNAFRKLVADYQAEAFEPVMTSRHDGKNFDVYLKESRGKTEGMLVLINDAENLYVLDILGRIALDKVTRLYSAIDGSTDIGSKIKAFAGRNKADEDKPK
jgi:hypothetical protein